MPTEELKFEDLIKEYIDVIESTDVSKLKEENKVIKVDIERKGKEEKDIDARIEQIQAELDSLNENSTVKLEYPEVIKDKEDKLKEAKDFKEKKQEEIKELKAKRKENNGKINRVKGIGDDVIKRAEEKTDKEKEEIEKKISELEERKAKYGIKIKEDIQYTKEEQIVVKSIDEEIDRLKHKIKENRKTFLLFKKSIEDAKKDKEAFIALKNKVKGKEETNKEESKEKLEEEKDNERKPEKTEEKPKKAEDIEHEEIATSTGKSGNEEPKNEPVKPREENKKPNKEPVKPKEEDTKHNNGAAQPKETNEIEEDDLVKEELEYKPVPGVAKPEEELHEVKAEDEENIYSNSYEKNLQEYKEILSMYKDAFLSLGDLQQQYENGEIPYSEYEKQAIYVAERYEFMKGEYAKIKGQYDIEKAKEDKLLNITNEDLENKLKELDEETTELWQQGVHENTPDAKRYHEALEEIKKIKEELKTRKENPLRGMSLEELEAKKHELYGKIAEQQEPDEYEFRTHKENGLEGYEDEIDKGLREIREEIERRQPKLEAPEEPVKAGIILEKNQIKENEESEKTFEEILYEVQAAKNAMSDAELGRYESAKGKWLVPVKYDKGDWLRNVARFITQKIFGSAVNIPRKLYSMIRTGKEQKEKIANITENVEGLNDKDFQVLLEGLQSYKGHENKVSASLRKAVQERAERETRGQNKQRDTDIKETLQFIKESHERSLEIAEKLKEEGLSNEERNKLIQEKKHLDISGSEAIQNVEMMRKEAALAQGGYGTHGLQEEDKAAREGSNLAGRKFAKRYSSNEELEKQQAELKKQQRESKAKGDDFTQVDAFIKHEELLENNTSTKKIMGITVSRSDRNHSTGVFTKEYKEDDLMRNVATIATVAATTINMIKQIQNAKALAEYNSRAQQADIANQQMAAKGEQLRQEVLNNEGVINKGIEGTDATRTAAAWGIGHEGAATPYNYTGGWGSKDLDKMFHQVINGNVTDQTVKDFITQGAPAIKAYAQAYPQFDYTALLDSMQKLGNGGIEAITQYNNAVRGVVQLAKDMGEITSTSVGTLALSPTYIETMMPLVMTGKTVTSKEYRKAVKEVKKKEKQENKRNFKEGLKVKSNKKEENKRNNETKEEHTTVKTKESVEVKNDDGR